MSSGIVPLVPDSQTVTTKLSGPPAPPAGIYIGGELRPFTPHCAVCEQPFQVKQVVQISNTEPFYRHTDCGDPTLAAGLDDGSSREDGGIW